MEEIGAGHIEKLATQHLLGGLLMSAVRWLGRDSETAPPFQRTVKQTLEDLKDAHGIDLWWGPDHSKLYRYW